MKHDQSAFRAYGRADPVADRVRRFTPLVRRAAWHIYGAGRDGLEIEDLMQAGYIALTEAARAHTGAGEDGFAAYARLRVRGAMYDMIRKLIPDSRGAVRRRREAEEAEEALRMELGRAPSAAELCDRLGIAGDELDQWRSAPVRLASLDAEYDEHNVQFASDTPDPFAVLSELEDREQLVEALATLPERLQLVLQLHFVEELNLTEIAAVLEVSVPRVHQLKAQALQRLRQIMCEEA